MIYIKPLILLSVSRERIDAFLRFAACLYYLKPPSKKKSVKVWYMSFKSQKKVVCVNYSDCNDCDTLTAIHLTLKTSLALVLQCEASCG